MGVKVKKMEYKNVPPAKYFAVIEKIESGEGKFGPQLTWAFKIEHADPEINGSIVSGLTGQLATPKAKITRWFYACDVTLTEEEIDADVIYGRRVVVTISENKTIRDGVESVFSNVTEVENTQMYEAVQPQTKPIQPQTNSPAQTPIQPHLASTPPGAPLTQPLNNPTQGPTKSVKPADLTENEDINF